jgi:hypothetical protein
MKIFDATSLIAFLGELNYPDGLRLLATRQKLLVTEGVVSEIKREPSRGYLSRLIDDGCLRSERVPEGEVGRLQRLHPQLGLGECEILAWVQLRGNPPGTFVVSDDARARGKFPAYAFVWTEQLLDYMRERGLIEEGKHRSLLEQLAKSTFYSRARLDGVRSGGHQPLR